MATPGRVTITPETTIAYPILITVSSRGLIHGDPDHQGRSNVKPFRRVGQVVSVSNPGKAVEPHQLDALLKVAPHPHSIGPYLETLSAPQYFAVALVARFLRHYNNQGLLDGAERYTRLADRLGQSASRSGNLSAWWSDLADALQVGGRGADDRELLLLLAMPHALAGHVLRVLADESETTIVFARAWHDDEKLMDADYAQKAGKHHNRAGYEIAGYIASELPPPAPTVIRDTPAFSGNALRHAIRMAACDHLLSALRLERESLPDAVGELLGNGGAIVSGATAPHDENMLGELALRAYPSLELLGGATGQFLLPKSMLSTPNWLVCTENRAALQRYDVTPHHPAEALIRVMTHTRMSEPPMPHAAEVLVQGSQILAVYGLDYGASRLCHGALCAALSWWRYHAPTLGGVASEGFGQVAFDLPNLQAFMEAWDMYDDYLSANRDKLRAGLLDGTLTTGKVICGKGSEDRATKKGKDKAKTDAAPAGGLFDAD